MTGYFSILKNFFRQSFRSVLLWIFIFVAPVAGFIAMFFLIQMSSGDKNSGFQAIGVLIMFIMFQGAFITGLCLQDREQGILKRIMASPVSLFVYSLGNITASFFVLALQVIITISLISVIFSAVIGTLLWKLFPLFIIFCMTATGFGLLICAICNTRSQLDLFSNFSICLTSIIGGCLFPADFMSPVMLRISYLFPQRWVMEAINTVKNGGGYSEIGFNLIILVLYTGLFIILHGAIRKRRPAFV